MTGIGWLHTLAALIALGAGAAVLLRRKGTRRHRQLGWLYAGSMLTLNVTALSIYRLTGRFGAFHVAALLSLATLAAGLIPALLPRRTEGWVQPHYYFMSYSYVGLLSAAASEAATRLPRVAFWWAVAAASVVV